MAYDPTNGTFDLVGDLTSQRGAAGVSVNVNGLTTINDSNGGIYIWSDASTDTADGFNVLAVSGVTTGRWLRSRNSNYQAGNVSFGGVALQYNYVVNHNLGRIPQGVILTPKSANAAAGAGYVSAMTSTTFTITFTGLPVVGTNNIQYYFVVVK